MHETSYSLPYELRTVNVSLEAVSQATLILESHSQKRTVVRWVVGEMLIEVEAGKASVIVTAR